MRATPLIALVLLAGCGDDGVVGGGPAATAPPPATEVTATLSLERPPPGPPDAGTSGHRAPDGVGETAGDTLRFEVRLAPPDATLTARAGRGAAVTVLAGRDGRNVVRVRGLRPGTTGVDLRATAAGARPWTGDVALRRDPR